MKRHEPFFSLALFLFCFLLYANNLKNEFVNYDDWWVVHNEKMLSWHTTSGFKKLFLGLSKETRFEHGAEFLPVRDLSASLQYRFFGESPTPYHVVQNILFSTSAVFFFQFLLSLGTSSAAAFLAALVFAAHPIHVESVTWLSGHKDVLSLFFALLSLWIYAKGRASLAFGIFLLALGSKYLILFLPVLLPPIDRVRGRPMSIRRYLLFFGASGATLGLSIYVASIVGYTPLPLGRSISGILRNVLALFDGGTSHLIAPLHLQLYYPYEPAVSWLDVRVWRGLAEVIALLAAFTYGWKNRSIVLIASTLWIAGFLPSLRTTEIHLLADRYLLFPSIGFAILCGAGLIHLSRWKGLGVMAPLIAVLLAAATIRQNRVWASSISLWEHAAYGDRPVQRETWENLANVYR
ncbi:MAG TPA: hypothetical protein VI895_14435, partial [Bdellovibrionota bacterium]|nr:hypothetical protein [Bdellovibrionota bacterium]